MPAFIAVIVAASFLISDDTQAFQMVAIWAQVFFFARVAHAVVYIAAIPYLRTPVYLVSWASILMIGFTSLV